MISPIPIAIYLGLALFAAFIVLAEVEHFRWARKQKRIARMAFNCAKGRIPRGTKESIWSKLIKKI